MRRKWVQPEASQNPPDAAARSMTVTMTLGWKMKKMMSCRLIPPINIIKREIGLTPPNPFHPPTPLGGFTCRIVAVHLPAAAPRGCIPPPPGGLRVGLGPGGPRCRRRRTRGHMPRTRRSSSYGARGRTATEGCSSSSGLINASAAPPTA